MIFNKFKSNSEFTKNVITLMTGTTVAQAIPIIISPILTRMYTPEDFGVFALYMSMVSLLTLIATGRYELAIMLPKKDKDAKYMLYLSMIISFAISILFMIIVYIFDDTIIEYIGVPELRIWLYFSPIILIMMALFQSLNIWNSRKKEYKTLAKNKVLRSISIGGTQLSLGALVLQNIGLIVGNLLGQLITTVILLKKTLLKNNLFIEKFEMKRMFILMKVYKKLPIFNLPNAFVDGVRLAGINILIGKYFSSAILGQFALAWRMVQAPLSIMGASLSPVLYQKTSRSAKSELNAIIKNFILKASMLSFPVFLIIYIFSVDIFIFVFGEEWKQAGEAASIMTPWLFLNFLSSPLSSIYIVINKQDFMLGFSVIYMLVPLSILIFFHDSNFLNTLTWITLAMTLLLVIFILRLYLYTREINNA